MAKLITEQDLDMAVQTLQEGGLVAIPTETVYGLGADATNSEAVNKIFDVKNRPVGHPLIVHIASAEQARLWVRDFDETAIALAEAFWPGPLTMILARNGRVCDEAVGSKTSIALRVPEHPIALALCEAFDGGIAAPSANKFGKVSPTTAEHVESDIGDEIELIIDGGKCEVGVESTIIDLTSVPTLLRPGGVAVSKISKVLGVEVVDGTDGDSRAPGMMKSHYSPETKLRVMSLEELTHEDFEIPETSGVVAPINVEHPLSWTMPTDAEGYARSLYSVFREADYRKIPELIVVPPTEGDILDAVLDRINKAAS